MVNQDQGMDDLSVDIDGFVIAASDQAKRLHNPIRSIVEGRKMPTNPSKELLNLTVGMASYIYRARAQGLFRTQYLEHRSNQYVKLHKSS